MLIRSSHHVGQAAEGILRVLCLPRENALRVPCDCFFFRESSVRLLARAPRELYRTRCGHAGEIPFQR